MASMRLYFCCCFFFLHYLHCRELDAILMTSSWRLDIYPKDAQHLPCCCVVPGLIQDPRQKCASLSLKEKNASYALKIKKAGCRVLGIDGRPAFISRTLFPVRSVIALLALSWSGVTAMALGLGCVKGWRGVWRGGGVCEGVTGRVEGATFIRFSEVLGVIKKNTDSDNTDSHISVIRWMNNSKGLSQYHTHIWPPTDETCVCVSVCVWSFRKGTFWFI